MRKTYVLDTNVLLQSPRALYGFEDNRLVIPLVVVEELLPEECERSELAMDAIKRL